MPEYLLSMMGQIPIENHPDMSRSRAIMTGLAQTMACADVVTDTWLNRVFNVLNQDDDFSQKLKRDAQEICYEHMDNVCDFKGLEVIRARWAPGMICSNIDRAMHTENRQGLTG